MAKLKQEHAERKAMIESNGGAHARPRRGRPQVLNKDLDAYATASLELKSLPRSRTR